MESELTSLQGEALPNVRLFTRPIGGAGPVLLTFRAELSTQESLGSIYQRRSIQKLRGADAETHGQTLGFWGFVKSDNE